MDNYINIVISGCTHGELDILYKSVGELETQSGKKVDLIICCGDFQAVRNYGDLEYMHCPPKYRSLRTFYKYYSGIEKAPYLTIFVGGNHEASSYLTELPHGGWVAPNIYYMGYSSVIQFGGLRIAGLSGIYNSYDFNKGHFECVPFTYQTTISTYHVRSIDMFRLKQLEDSGKIDIMITHDWPTGITKYGNENELLRVKPYFREDIEKNKLGNPFTMELMKKLKPSYWFSAHMHCKFAALVPHDNDTVTRFLALDKPIPGRQFLQFVSISNPDNNEKILKYDETWLSILQLTDHLTNLSSQEQYMPNESSNVARYNFKPTLEDKERVKKCFDNNFEIPNNFQMTAPPYIEKTDPEENKIEKSLSYENPQTAKFCQSLDIIDINKIFYQKANINNQGVCHYRLINVRSETFNNPIDEEIDINDEDLFFEDA
uniref:DBR1 domain-containing protein n=1 Tax=Parastrongyloides trichosuri TaxID=131310 RepID=A0A0N4ZNP2_PARTI